MFTQDEAWRLRDTRGPRYAVYGAIRPHEAETCYADTAGQAEQIRSRMLDLGRYQVAVYPPEGSIDLTPLRTARENAEALAEATGKLRAAVLRALADGRCLAEVARAAGLSTDTLLAWQAAASPAGTGAGLTG